MAAILYLVLGATALGALTPSLGATLILEAAYVTALLLLLGIRDARFDPASIVLLWFVLVFAAALAGVTGQSASAWARRTFRGKRRGLRYYYE